LLDDEQPERTMDIINTNTTKPKNHFFMFFPLKLIFKDVK